ncbi:hypothetical protein C1646_758504 [Rhizophagus diaphanus]|nr:hypothetical protein C1646_758504 [Rhizophagus diaphanus] [Rhizophagus sp. MUCL 43196]
MYDSVLYLHKVNLVKINNEYEFNSNIVEGSSAAAQRQNTEQPPAKKAKIKQNTTKVRTSWVWNYFEISNDNTEIQARYHQEVLDYILEDIQPISCVKKPRFNKLLNSFDSHVTLPSDHKIHEMVSKSYNYTYRELYKFIRKDAKSVALTADFWSSGSRHPYIGLDVTQILILKKVIDAISTLALLFKQVRTGVDFRAIKDYWSVREDVSYQRWNNLSFATQEEIKREEFDEFIQEECDNCTIGSEYNGSSEEEQDDEWRSNEDEHYDEEKE